MMGKRVSSAGDECTKHYQFRSYLRPNLLAKTSIQYPKIARKASLGACASRWRASSRIQSTPNSIALCILKQCFRGIFDGEKHINTATKLLLNSYSADLNRPKALVLQMRHVLAATPSSFIAAAPSERHLMEVAYDLCSRITKFK
jgi:hypothetical protein